MTASATQHRLVTLRLSADLIAALELEAHRREISPAQMIRLAIVETVRRRAPASRAPVAEGTGAEGGTGTAAPPSNYAPRPSLIAATFDAASDWLDLQRRLRTEGLVLRLHEESWSAESRVALHDWPSDRFVIWLDETGQSLGELMMRFRAPFPGGMRRAPIVLPPGTFRALRQRSAQRVSDPEETAKDGRAA